MANHIVVREFDYERDSESIEELDTSFTSSFVYKVTGDGNSLHLTVEPADPPLHKRFPIDLDEQTWTQGFVAVGGKSIVGFIATAIEPWNRRMVIWHFYVNLPSRGQGIGRHLMERAMEHGRLAGASTAWIETSNQNYPGVEAYRHLGFSLCGFDTTHYVSTPAQGEFALFLARPLGETREV